MEPRTQKINPEFTVFNETVESLIEQARRDLTGDGLNLKDASFVLELDMLYGGQFHVKRALSPLLAVHSSEDVRAICDAFNKEFSEAFSPFVVNPEGGIFIESFILKAIVPTKKIELPKFVLEGPSPAAARKGERPVYWPPEKDFRPTPIFTYESLRKHRRRPSDRRRRIHHAGSPPSAAFLDRQPWPRRPGKQMTQHRNLLAPASCRLSALEFVAAIPPRWDGRVGLCRCCRLCRGRLHFRRATLI
jgi:hypothetical protein